MATLKLFLKNQNGDFSFDKEKSQVVYLSSFEEDMVVANGWEVAILLNESGDQELMCQAIRFYSDGMHTYNVSANLRTGKYTCCLNGQQVKKGFLTRKGEKIEGLIGLSGGNIDDRYFYFRGNEFGSFLSNHGLTAVKKKNPNDVYFGFRTNSGNGTRKFQVFTDGSTSESVEDLRSENWRNGVGGLNSNLWNSSIEIRVVDATWVIVDESHRYKDSAGGAKILYTLSDPMKLELPL